jgi:regulator of protease activity HflC (stomatin/prohibitin superfamily)
MRRQQWPLLAAALAALGCADVPAGAQGVLFKRFGEGVVLDSIYGEGVHLVPPWNYMVVYNVRTQDREEEMEILTSNGLDVGIELSVRYRPNAEELPRLHQTIGPSYYDVLIRPVLRSSVREVVGQYTPEEIYSTRRDEIQKEIFQRVLEALRGKHLDVETVLIRAIVLPEKLRMAISEKLEEEQRAEKMRFTLERERQEAERKRIEAQGITDFQKIVSQGLNDQLLKWKGIEATEKLAASPNAKVVVIGSGTDGLPLILGQ